MPEMLLSILDFARDWAGNALLLAGGAFVVIGAIGVLRFPDFYSRIHAAGVTDTLGAELIIFGLMLKAGWSLDTAKLAVVGLFLFLTSPTATHAVANAAFTAGIKPILGRFHPGDPRTRQRHEQDTGDEEASA